MIRFQLHTDVTIGNGAVRGLDRFLCDRAFSRPALLVDEGFMASDLWQAIESSMRAAFPSTLVVHGRAGTAEPTYADLDSLAERFRREHFDVLVGIGGGSCMDLAKGVAALRTNPGLGLEYRGFDKLKEPAIPTVLVPTTAGTGSEVTINASFVDSESKRKLGINGRYMSATYAILDGETTLSCPYRAALGAGVDALVHVLESFVARQQNAMTRVFAREAFRLLIPALPTIKEDPTNLDRRLELLRGAYFAAISLFNAGSGIAGGLSYPLGVHFGVPHGLGGGIFCLDVVAYNLDRGYYDYAELGDVIGITSGNREERGRAVLARLRALFALLGVPRKLTDLGLQASQYDALVEQCQILQGAFDQNPVPFTVQSDMPQFLQKYF